MRWIIKLRNAKNELRYVDLIASSEVGAVASALDANPDWWLVRAWPVTDAELREIEQGGA